MTQREGKIRGEEDGNNGDVVPCFYYRSADRF